MIQKLVLGVSGASGVGLAKRFIEHLPKDIELFVVLSKSAKTVFEKERATILDNEDIGACTASGSFRVDAMAVIPCSMNSLAKIAHGISDNLLTRSAAVAIKERRVLLLAPREIPYSPIALTNMQTLSQLGVIIAPAVLGYYADIKNLEMMENFIVGKWFDLLGIEHKLYKRWEG